MKKRSTIFLSYRRDDIPGYVRQLQEDLQRYFGGEKVFRDVEDIAGGQHWKEVLSESLAQSAALVVIIGPRWEQIWHERVDKNNDYIVYELNKAREIKVPIIPVTINGTVLPMDMDLGTISWLMDMQHYDISDRQGRWPADVLGLVKLLEREKGLVRKKIKSENSGKKYLLIPLVIAVLAFIGYQSEPIPESQLTSIQSVHESQPDMSIQAAMPSPTTIPEPVPSSVTLSPPTYPDIAGYWQDEEGYFYEIGQAVDGTFMVSASEMVAFGQFMPDMSRKFVLQVSDMGYGEYSVATDNMSIVGWFHVYATDETSYETIWRVN